MQRMLNANGWKEPIVCVAVSTVRLNSSEAAGLARWTQLWWQ